MTTTNLSRGAMAAALVIGLAGIVPGAQAQDQDCNASALIAQVVASDDLAATVDTVASCLAAVDTPCTSQATAGAGEPWEFYLTGIRDPPDGPGIPSLYYLASWSGIMHFDSECQATSYQCTINVEDSWFQTLSVRNANGNWVTTTTGSYHGLATSGGFAYCGEGSAGVSTRVGALLPLTGSTV